MRKSIFRKEFSVTGTFKTVQGEVIATMNDSSKTVTGTHAGTHDDYSKPQSTHKVQLIIEGEVVSSASGIVSENEVYKISEAYLKDLKRLVEDRANTEPVVTFAQKMQELFK